jgi:hypothetical protein
MSLQLISKPSIQSPNQNFMSHIKYHVLIISKKLIDRQHFDSDQIDRANFRPVIFLTNNILNYNYGFAWLCRFASALILRLQCFSFDASASMLGQAVATLTG